MTIVTELLAVLGVAASGLPSGAVPSLVKFRAP